MVILVLNCGSSSVKYQVYDWDAQVVTARGVVERVGTKEAVIDHSAQDKSPYTLTKDLPSHLEAIQLVLETLLDPSVGALKSLNEIKAVGHRVLTGGAKIAQSVLINPEVLATFRSLVDLGPLHMPANITGIEAAMKALPGVPQAAVMDTAWHQTMPATSYTYAVPYEWYENFGVRRYGFHGTSFLYTAKRASVLLGKKPQDTNLIIAHIGNGASMSAVKNGQAFDTSMGLTPLEGLVMGTRSGDIDPAIISFVMSKTGKTAKEVETDLNKKSGILGVTQKYTDRRDMNKAADAGDPQSILAREMECYRIKKYMGSYMAALGRVDAIVMTAGVGEFGWQIREKALEGLENLGIILDKEKNKISTTRNAETLISTDHSPIKIFVIPTDEELVMTEDTYALMKGTYNIHTSFAYSFQDPAWVNKERALGLEKELVKKPDLAKIVVPITSQK
ncbi:MAG: propionate kinase [Spirochaetes bacterium GWB1_48_6]|nr:MAG: propionate kinase [Spirochaetes bacterium GWB1_48_6]